MPKLPSNGPSLLDDYVIVPDGCVEGVICQQCLLRLMRDGMEKWEGIVLENGKIRFGREVESAHGRRT